MIEYRSFTKRILIWFILWCIIFIPVYTVKNVYFGYNFQSVDICINDTYIQNNICDNPQAHNFITQCYQIHVNYRYNFNNENYYCDIPKEQSFETSSILQIQLLKYSNNSCENGYFRKVDMGKNNACYFNIDDYWDLLIIIIILSILAFAICMAGVYWYSEDDLKITSNPTVPIPSYANNITNITMLDQSPLSKDITDMTTHIDNNDNNSNDIVSNDNYPIELSPTNNLDHLP